MLAGKQNKQTKNRANVFLENEKAFILKGLRLVAQTLRPEEVKMGRLAICYDTSTVYTRQSSAGSGQNGSNCYHVGAQCVRVCV